MGTCVTKHPHKQQKVIVSRSESKKHTASTSRPSGISPLSVSTLKNEGQELSSPTGRKIHAVTITTAGASRSNIPSITAAGPVGVDCAEEHLPKVILDNNPNKTATNFNSQNNELAAAAEFSETKSIQHKSVFLKAMDCKEDDPIARIVRLEEACIRLKSRLEKEKLKLIAKSKPKPSSHHQFGQNQGFYSDNDARCFATIIKLADFVQEKSQRLWEDPHDIEVSDALASLEYASKMLQIDCLLDFQRDVAMALPPDSPIRQNHKHLLRAQSQQPPSENQLQQLSDPQLKVEVEIPKQPQLLQLYPIPSDNNHQSAQHYTSPSHPQHSPEQEEDEPVNDPELEILAPETKCQHQIFLPCNSNTNPTPDTNKINTNNTLPQTGNKLTPVPISDAVLKQSNLVPTAPPQNQHSPFGSPVSPLVLDCQ